MKIYQKRDLTIMEISGNIFVIACDSSGGIGRKQHDELCVDPFFVGKLCARVALMEILSVGADPVVLVNTLCVEMNPTGKRILEGIRSESWDMRVVTGSSEENMMTLQTGIGITVVGICESLKIGLGRRGDSIAAVGRPSVGADVLIREQDLPTGDDVMWLRQLPYIGDIIPVGSQGIRKEASHLGGIKFFDTPLDMNTSCGPSTVILITLPPDKVDTLESEVKKPFHVIGEILNPTKL